MAWKLFLVGITTSTLGIMVSATPTVQGEIFYLANCGERSEYSTMAYYKDYAQSQAGQQPDGLVRLPGTGWVRWEGITWSARLPSGNVFTSKIDTGAESKPYTYVAGSGQDNFHNFTCYKDNKRLLYVDSSGWNCYSIYYCT